MKTETGYQQGMWLRAGLCLRAGMISGLMLMVSTLLLATTSQAAEKRTLCVFDPLGAYGDTYGLLKEYAKLVKPQGVDFELKPYTDEAIAANDFLGSACDAAVLTGTRARNFNKFTGTIEAIGALPEYSHVKALLKFLSNDKLSKYMKNDRYEIAGIYPVGAVYLFVNDRSIDTASELAGKRLATMSFDDAANTMVKHVGAAPVSADITTFAGKFNNGSVDVCYAPSLAYNAFELYKGLNPGGGVIRFPLAQMNAQIILKNERFPEGFGLASRKIVREQAAKAFTLIEQQDQSIDNKWWVDIPPDDKEQYMEMFRGVRIQLANNDTYHPSMLKLMKKIRCAEDASHSECTRDGE
ncbi:MAG: putative solute-binding protein [Ketobacteraceae bacterium]|nr:putative solute-binding protein [Ketobacteraceae bacterium]